MKSERCLAKHTFSGKRDFTCFQTLFLIAVSLLHITGKPMISDQLLLKVVGFTMKMASHG